MTLNSIREIGKRYYTGTWQIDYQRWMDRYYNDEDLHENYILPM